MFETFLNNKTKEMNTRAENLYQCLWHNECLSAEKSYTGTCRKCTKKLKGLLSQIKDLVSGVENLKELHLEVRQVCHLLNTA